MRRGISLVVILLAGLAAGAEAQYKESVDGLRVIHDWVTKTERKEAQCLRAIGNREYCGCIATKLPSIDFVQFVAMLARSDEEMDYDKLSSDDKKIIDTARKCRDLCLKWKGGAEGELLTPRNQTPASCAGCEGGCLR